MIKLRSSSRGFAVALLCAAALALGGCVTIATTAVKTTAGVAKGVVTAPYKVGKAIAGSGDDDEKDRDRADKQADDASGKNKDAD